MNNKKKISPITPYNLTQNDLSLKWDDQTQLKWRKISESLTNHWRKTLAQQLHWPVQLECFAIDLYFTEDFLNELENLCVLTKLTSTEANFESWIFLDSAAITTLVHFLLGGTDKYPQGKTPKKQITKSEITLVSNIIRKIANDFRNIPLKKSIGLWEIAELESNPRLATVALPKEQLVVIQLGVEIQGQVGSLIVALPKSLTPNLI